VPSIPLTDLYNHAGDYIRARGGEIRFRTSLESFSPDSSQVRIQLSDKSEITFDYLVLALPFDALERVLPQSPQAAPLRDQITHFESSPITGIHLWFDRQITDLDHAVLLDRTVQWMFHKSRLLESTRAQSEERKDNKVREGRDFSSEPALSRRRVPVTLGLGTGLQPLRAATSSS
jgi:Flavin containing amine oxidoreductase